MGFWQDLIEGVRWLMSENRDRDIEIGLIRREYGTVRLLDHLQPDRVHGIIAAYYHRRGAVLRWVSRREGGADLVAYHYTGEIHVVLVRHRARVSPGDVHDLAAARRDHQASRAIIYTTEPPTGQLAAIALDLEIEVRDGNQIADILDDLERHKTGS